jgi:translocation and assembly module TamB
MDFISQPRLAGNLTAEFKKLALLSAFVPQLQDISGQLTANLNLSGTLPVPRIRGEVRLLNAATDIPQAGTRIQDIQLTLSSDGQGPLRLSGMARSGSGQLNLSGQLEPTSGQADLAINGENFQAVNTPSIQALISPDIKLALVERQVRTEGQLVIPKAYLSPPGGTSGRVNPSSDVVFVNDKGDRATPSQKGLAIVTKIRVILGDDIYVEAAGFKGQLKGTLLVEETPQLAPRGTGTIEVVAGDYKIYGEEIAIERGRLLFSGGPIDNPGLDLRVARKVDDITAGAQVSGTLKSPRLKLFSTPPMPDSGILSYLVLGQSPQGSSAAQSAMLYRAATALGMSGGGNQLFAGISKTLNLDNFEFESSSKGEGASLLIGKYLTPSLYISYGVGLFKAVNTFKLRYRLSKRLNLETATSSDHSSADLIYTLER